ncbi:tetratricopeptide repeat protein [Amycolatopsis acidicola]|uniref:Tetratricopeptide repeat protein n=1 Tax=Amycolatopsis acidicola TaxID=2596893 RepID=A0A5N0V1J2_9PSEU|nr:tetratricopeptide repeat protein [Amycolatopsis acidicola]KAA9160256.1 tetratricopeptide repeat protein [Amycolatopsis acidicola]
MVDRKPAVPEPYTARWSAGPITPSRSPLRSTRTAELQERLDRLRATYRTGHTAETVTAARALISDVGTDLLPQQPDYRHRSAIDASARTILALTLDEQDRFADAAARFARAGELVRRRGDFAGDYGIALASSGEAAEGRRMLETAIELGEDAPDVRRALAAVLRTSGDHEAALRAYAAAVERAPHDWRAQVERAELLSEMDSDPVETGAGWLAAAKALLAADRVESAAGAAARVPGLAPDLAPEAELVRAEALISAGRTDEARSRLNVADDTAWTRNQLLAAAEMLVEVGALDDAGKAVESLRATAPDDPDALVLQAQLLVNQGKAEDARPLVDQLTTDATDDPRAFLLQGMVALDTGDPDTAVAALEHADELKPGHPVVLAQLGVALAQSGRLEAGVRFLDRSLEANPNDVPNLLARSRALLELGRTAEAEADARVAARFDPESGTAHWLVGELAGRTGRTEEALRHLDRAVGLDPTLGRAWRVRGDHLTRLGRRTEARESFEAALRLDDRNVPALTGLANVLLNAEEDEALPRAEQAIRRALELDPDRADANAMHGEILRRQGHREEALAALEKALRLLPGYAYAEGARGEVLISLGRPEEGIVALARAVELTPEVGWLRIRLGKAYLARYHETGERMLLDAALDCLRPATEDSTVDSSVWRLLGEAHLLAGDPLAAADALDRADGGTEAHLLRARARLQLDRPAEAVDDLREAGERVEVLALRAEAERADGRSADALADAAKVLDKDPANVLALTVRGALRAEQGEKAEAEADLRAALDHDPVNRRAASLLRKLLEPDEAVELLASVIERAPGDLALRTEYARALLAAGDHRAALAELDELLWRSPEEPEMWRLLAEALSAAGRHHEAVSAYLRVREAVPYDMSVLTRLASEQARSGDFEGGLATLEEASETPLVLTLRAHLLSEVDRWTEAREAAERAVELDGRDLQANLVLGWVVQHGPAKDRSRAKEIYRHATTLDAKNPWAHKGLANALFELEETGDAEHEYHRVLDLLRGASPGDMHAYALRGWCLYRLGTYWGAVDCLQRAVDDPELRLGALFDLLLALLGLGEDDEAHRTGLMIATELRRVDKARARSLLTVGLDNLRAAAAPELPAAAPHIEEFERLYRECS